MLVNLSQAVSLLEQGQVVAMPTETVYGLAADAANDSALTLLYQTKGRPTGHPVILHVADLEMARPYVTDLSAAALALMEAFWPGPLTLLLPRSPLVSSRITGGRPLVGVRAPAAPLAQELLRLFGRALVAPSANRFGHISPTTADHVEEEFDGQVAVIDGGACQVGLESTILAVEHDRLLLLRPGQLCRRDLERASGLPVEEPVVAVTEGVPGSLKSHYAPRQPVSLLSLQQLRADAGEEAAILTLSKEDNWPAAAFVGRLSDQAELYGRELYSELRKAEGSGCRRILVELPPTDRSWQAVHDRLTRAAAPSPG